MLLGQLPYYSVISLAIDLNGFHSRPLAFLSRGYLQVYITDLLVYCSTQNRNYVDIMGKRSTETLKSYNPLLNSVSITIPNSTITGITVFLATLLALLVAGFAPTSRLPKSHYLDYDRFQCQALKLRITYVYDMIPTSI